MTVPTQNVAVAIIGGGPSGLTAAAALAPDVDVLVLEREAELGGIPRHSDHPGYGMRDLRRFMSGPAYARRLTVTALDAGAILETEAMVTGWVGERLLQVTSPRGVRTVAADAVVLATGARERPRPARLIPGDRPDGVYTTGQLQNLVHLHHAEVGTRALIVGGELVSWSAVLTLREAHCATVAMVTDQPRSESYAAFRIPGRTLMDGPVLTRSRLVSIHGKDRVRAAVVENLDTGARTTVECDTVVFTGDWIPDHELARTAGLAMDAGTRGPVVDAALRTSAPGVFAVGNLLHPVDTADGAALDGRHVAPAVRNWLRRRDAPEAGLRIRTDGPFRWVAPQLITPNGGSASRDDLLFWVDEYRRVPKLRAVQDGRVLGTARTPWPAAPGRVYRAPWSLVARADPHGGDVTVSFA
ncbi:NAD(P)/FAD-dependent oxidoreductase [Mycolicibacterium litorale]|uniref:Oxidoreductase n=1 Tax=Mycolicibacterium litorale TaxID=758802 RepID=A0AAD1IGN0_9MYCO|nr:FAD-dependent oxidoreductase [Mycolicibacterium litorale]MCV7413761.1 FAD-dependent oxidoreductase [Mycolicibacterium litorale]TDY03356.1 thioredoxin reductase [Mycolicibacterium litorale]BBY15152.1 oxidoreductase [Mycolicibacterium litorale]